MKKARIGIYQGLNLVAYRVFARRVYISSTQLSSSRDVYLLFTQTPCNTKAFTYYYQLRHTTFQHAAFEHIAHQHAAFLNTLKSNKLTLLRCLAQTWLDWSALNEGKVEFGILKSWKQSDRLCYWARKIVWLVRNHEDDCENNLRQSVK